MKSELERRNFDLAEQKIRLRETEKRLTSKELARVSLELAGKGLKEFVNDKVMMSKVILGITGAYILGYGCKSGLNVIFQYFSTRLMTPRLIRETSRIPINQFYKYPLRLYNRYITKKDTNNIMEGIILKPELESQLRVISHGVINRKRHNAPFRNLLFYGPPGTGKTLFAKQLANRSGLDFAILTGADVAPLNTLAVHELHKIFDWAETSKNGINMINDTILGLLIFVDESDAFLRRRAGDELISENLRNAINAFLYRTGTPSSKFMVVLATNAPQLLDTAIQDRIDEMILFDRPSIKERANILYHYLLKFCQPQKKLSEKIEMWIKHPSTLIHGKKTINISQLDSNFIDEIAARTEGFSGRELTKLVVAWHDAAFAKDVPILDKETVEKVLVSHLQQDRTKDDWNETQKKYFKLLHPKI